MRTHLPQTHEIPNPNDYIIALQSEFSEWALDEYEVAEKKGLWKTEVFKADVATPLDVEIGTGNGVHFAHYSATHPERLLLGFEIKFKPLIQSIRRALRGGQKNMRMARYNARLLSEVFAEGEIDNIIVHHPDPWPKKRQWKHRLIQQPFLEDCFRLQRPGSYFEFKTDSAEYFDWAMERFEASEYNVIEVSNDFHQSERGQKSFRTHFESLFARQGIKIHYALMTKPSSAENSTAKASQEP